MKVIEYTDFRLSIRNLYHGHHIRYYIDMYVGTRDMKTHILDVDVLLFLGNTLFIDYRVMGAYGSKQFLLEYRS